MSSNFRTEHDFLGEKQIPAVAYWGVHTARAVENFAISGTRISAMPDLVRALAYVKKAAARANADLGALDRDRAAAIILACDDLIEGKLLNEFVVDVIQGGAGTSTNMNANEVICQPGARKAGPRKRRVPSAAPQRPRQRLAEHQRRVPHGRQGWRCGSASASPARGDGRLARRLCEAKAEEFKEILKMGRTQLQDAVPMTLGQEFLTYAIMIGEDEQRLAEARALIERNQPRRHRHRHRHQCAPHGYANAGLPRTVRASPACRSSSARPT